MKKLLLGLVFVMAMALPAHAGSELPPCEQDCAPTPPPCLTPDCDTPDTGHDLYPAFLLLGGSVVVGSVALRLGRRR